LNCLAFLEALEAARIDRRVMNEHILAVLAADKAKPLGIVKPLYCSLFHDVSFPLLPLKLPLDPNRGFAQVEHLQKTNLFQTMCEG
jgi:hypothetical protein